MANTVEFRMFAENAKPSTILSQLILEAREIREKLSYSVNNAESKRNHNLALVLSIIYWFSFCKYAERSLRFTYFYVLLN